MSRTHVLLVPLLNTVLLLCNLRGPQHGEAQDAAERKEEHRHACARHDGARVKVQVSTLRAENDMQGHGRHVLLLGKVVRACDA
jgi:hypothetical protein